MLGGPPEDVSKAGQPEDIEQGGATKGNRNYPQNNDPAIPTTRGSDKQRIPFPAFPTQPLFNLPGVAVQEDSTDHPDPTGDIVPGELITEKPVTNHGPPADVVASTPEEEGECVVSVNGDCLTCL